MKFPKVFLKRSLLRKIQGTGNLENTHIFYKIYYIFKIYSRIFSKDRKEAAF